MIDNLPPNSNFAGKPMDTSNQNSPEPKADGRKPLDSKEEASEVARKLDAINIARKYRDRVLDDMGVERFYKEYFGEYDVRLGGLVVPPIGEVFAYVQASIATLYSKDPSIAVNAMKTGSIQGAALLETSVNYYQRFLRAKEEFEIELTDALLCGHAWHKTGNNVQTVGWGGGMRITSDKLYSTHVSYKDIVFNIGSRRPPSDCRWIAQRLIRPTDEIKKKYGARAAGLVGGPHPSLKKDELKASNFKGDLNFSTMWEMHDIEERKVYLMAEGHDKYLKVPSDWPDYVSEFPFRMLWWNYNPESAYPISDIKAWEPQVLEKIKFVGMIMNHLKRYSRQMAVKKGAVSLTELDKYQKGIDGSMIEVKTSGSPSDVLVPIQYAPLPPEIFALLNKFDEIMNNVNGQPSVDRGAPQRTVSRTEGELAMIQKGAKSRTDRKVAKLEDHIETVAKDLIAHMQGNFDIEQTMKITGDTPQEIIQAFGDKYDPASKTIRFTKDDIQGEYDVDVQAGSTLPLDKETRMQLLSIILDKASRLATLPSLPPFMEVIIKELLKDYGIKALEQAFELQQKQAAAGKANQVKAQGIDQDKTIAETEKRKAQAGEQKAETILKIGEALHQAHQANVLPEAIELGRGMGLFPGEEEGTPEGQQPRGMPPQQDPNGMQ